MSEEGRTYEGLAAELLRQFRVRLESTDDVDLAESMVGPLVRLSDAGILMALDRVARADLTSYIERSLLPAMTEAERHAWRRHVTDGWHRQTMARWQAREDLRMALVEAILAAKAAAILAAAGS